MFPLPFRERGYTTPLTYLQYNASSSKSTKSTPSIHIKIDLRDQSKAIRAAKTLFTEVPHQPHVLRSGGPHILNIYHEPKKGGRREERERHVQNTQLKNSHSESNSLLKPKSIDGREP